MHQSVEIRPIDASALGLITIWRALHEYVNVVHGPKQKRTGPFLPRAGLIYGRCVDLVQNGQGSISGSETTVIHIVCYL